MNDYPELSAMHLDALREISNIGMGNAVTALAQLVNRRIDMKVPRAQFMPFEETIALVGGLEEEVACVSLRILGDVPGTVLFVFSGDSARRLVDLLMGMPPGTTVELDEIGQSAVKEIGNVLTGAFINALSQLTMLNMITTVPMFAMDMLGAVMADLMIASGRVEDHVLVIGTDLVHEGEMVINGHFFLLTDPGSIDKLFAALGLA
ncbi:MAG: chemotaxis protein CheC [Desulfurispora sp.]|uniref:chemotaxis protein CheC n=1 Tax=Desulfurispora sp. TaxID=3014275 RepID=UPI00404A49C5